MSEPDLNPYAAPRQAEVLAEVTETMLRHGRLLLVRDGAVLPDLCPVTGETIPADAMDACPRKLTWVPSWTYIGVFFGILPYFILALASWKRGTVTYRLSAKARIARRNRRLTGGLLLVAAAACLGGFVASGPASSDTDFYLMMGFILLLILGILSLAFAEPIKLAGYGPEGWFRFTGCGPAFLKTRPEASSGNWC